ncbi:cyclin-T1-2-like isoform X1 [Typha angustifolia]|uniref:cyclin-T1-2-like isoform X1 n=1 Tax=Typha angustifolia TaxID=59011 RepID=UPI003C2C4547
MFENEDTRVTGEASSEHMLSWYFSREEVENNSPSRKDGINLRKESELRMSYCLFLREVGIRLKLPQLTIATAIMFCHRFYLHQSHVKNEWQTIATACIFLASKVEDTPCALDDVVRVAYGTTHRRDPAAVQRIHQKDIFQKQKALILIGERLLLSTIRFDFNIQHPYRPLLDALKKLGITRKDVGQVAWNFVNDWLRTTMCLQYKAHYIAAGSLYVAAKLHNVKLPSERGYVWWHEFDVDPRRLEIVIQHMIELLGSRRKSLVAHPQEKPIQTPLGANQQVYNSPDSVLCRTVSSMSSSTHDYNGQANTREPANSDDHNSSSSLKCGERSCLNGQPRESGSSFNISVDGERFENYVDKEKTEPDIAGGVNKIDILRIKEMIKKRKGHREFNGHPMISDDSSEDVWIERELESGIALGAEPVDKKQRLLTGSH